MLTTDPLSFASCSIHKPYHPLSWCGPCNADVLCQALVEMESATPQEFRVWIRSQGYSYRATLERVLLRYPDLDEACTVAAHLFEEWGRTHQLFPGDYFCVTCDFFVSRLEGRHWDLICGSCGRHERYCDKCDECNEHVEACTCCGNCGLSQYDCTCDDDDGGDGDGDGDGDGESTYTRHDASKLPRWLIPGQEGRYSPFQGTVPTADQADTGIDPVRAAADFYLLSAVCDTVRFSDATGSESALLSLSGRKEAQIRSDSMLSAARTAARRDYSALVTRLDATFLAYATSAVGGELRYHPACRYKANFHGARSAVWNQFAALVQEKGANVLLDAVDLFAEFTGGSYGGKKWGDAAAIVAKRLSGEMPPWLFVDRMFTLEHNGGCFLNKLDWTTSNGLGYGLYHMQRVLNAHAGKCITASKDQACDCKVCAKSETGWALLLQVASPGVASLFRMADDRIRRIAARSGATIGSLPTKNYGRADRYGRIEGGE